MKYEIKQAGQNGVILGEFSLETVRSNVQSGAIEKTFLARRLDSTQWITVAALLENPCATASPATSAASVAVERNANKNPLLTRYTDSYRVARTVTAFGASVKVLAIVVGAAVGMMGILASNQNQKYISASIAIGFIIAVPIFILGIIVSAQGQTLKATLDTAVNSSPLLTKDEMREIMSLD